MRIALFTYSTKPRGGVIHTLELAEALQQAGHYVCIYALDKDRVGFHRPLRCPYKLVPTKPAPERQLLMSRTSLPQRDPVDQLIKQRIQEFIDYLLPEQEQYDIYHSQDCISSNALQVLRDKKLIPHFIRTVHHLDQFNSPYLQACHDRSITEPDLCLCVSQYWQQQLQEQYQITAPIIINGVNLERFTPASNDLKHQVTALKQKLGTNTHPVYLTIGGIEPRKNSLQLLEAFIEFLKTYPQAQLIIAGGETLFDYEPYRLEFFNLARQHQIEIGKTLLLPGVIADRDLPVLYHCADGFIFPSVKEGWGLALLEAIASGLPVITSNIPPFTEFLNQDTALLVDPDSSQAIAEAMIALLDQNLAQQLINNSASIPQQYSWAKSAQIHLDIYQELVR